MKNPAQLVVIAWSLLFATSAIGALAPTAILQTGAFACTSPNQLAKSIRYSGTMTNCWVTQKPYQVGPAGSPAMRRYLHEKYPAYALVTILPHQGWQSVVNHGGASSPAIRHFWSQMWVQKKNLTHLKHPDTASPTP